MRGKILLVLCAAALVPLAAQNRNYTLDEALKETGTSLRWDPFFASGALLAGDHRLAFYTASPGETGAALFDGREILTLPAPYLEKGDLIFPAAFVAGAKSAFSSVRPASPEAEKGRFRVAAIIIDPGHGGKDSGAAGTHTVNGKTLKSVEKDITLAVSRELADMLRAAWPEKRVLLTRTGDTYPSLEDRVNIANTVPLKDNEAIIYISIHANASLNKTARGYEVWYLPPETRRELIDREKYAGSAEIIPILNDMLQAEFTAESTDLGRHILRRFGEILGNSIPSRGLKAENWYVVRNARMPAVLVELGFVSSSEDAALMADPAGLKRFAEGLYKGIIDFTAEFERSGG